MSAPLADAESGPIVPPSEGCSIDIGAPLVSAMNFKKGLPVPATRRITIPYVVAALPAMTGTTSSGRPVWMFLASELLTRTGVPPVMS